MTIFSHTVWWVKITVLSFITFTKWTQKQLISSKKCELWYEITAQGS